MKIFTYEITGRRGYREIGIIQAISLEEAQSILDEVCAPGPNKGIAAEPRFDEYGMLELFSSN